MNPIYFADLALSIALAASCHKPDTATPAVSPATWNYGPFHFTAHLSSSGLVNGVFQLVFLTMGTMGSDVPSITFNFTKRPLRAGSYKIVEFPRADNELSIFCNGGDGAFYNSTGNDEATVQLSFTNGKLSLYCDKAVVKQDLFAGGDSTCLSFNLSEY